MRLPAPFNANLPTVQSAYSIAVSETRAWWMVNLDSSFQVRFLTAPLDGSAPPSVVTLTLPDGCVLNEFDFGPWVTPDGKLLFVNAAERDTSCASIEPRVEDILVFQLDETGQPIGPGVPLPGISRRGTTEVDASLSSDMCWLYFTAPLADGGMHGASRARRRR